MNSGLKQKNQSCIIDWLSLIRVGSISSYHAGTDSTEEVRESSFIISQQQSELVFVMFQVSQSRTIEIKQQCHHLNFSS
jgi:hypothetical protein